MPGLLLSVLPVHNGPPQRSILQAQLKQRLHLSQLPGHRGSVTSSTMPSRSDGAGSWAAGSLFHAGLLDRGHHCLRVPISSFQFFDGRKGGR